MMRKTGDKHNTASGTHQGRKKGGLCPKKQQTPLKRSVKGDKKNRTASSQGGKKVEKGTRSGPTTIVMVSIQGGRYRGNVT